MCNGRLLAHEITDRFGILVEDHFADELAEMNAPGGLVEAGFVVINGNDIEATPVGRMFIRNVAMVFDTRLKARATEDQIFSRTV
jgi:oxygen-independent coproporphyrinogen-3 oxidase